MMVLKFAANLSLMFNETAFPDRFAAAAEAGFTAIEYLFPYDYDARLLADKLATHGLKQALFNLPPGDWSAGEKGFAALPERREHFRASLQTALPYALATKVPNVHLMAGIAPADDSAAIACFRDSIVMAADFFGAHGIGVVIEPINPRDVPGYFLNDFDRAADFIALADRSNLRLQFDIYHRQIVHGDVVKGLEKYLPITAHIQIAAVPHRNEPGTGELDDAYVLRYLAQSGYDGFIGCEYRPRGDTRDGLVWRDKLAGV